MNYRGTRVLTHPHIVISSRVDTTMTDCGPRLSVGSASRRLLGSEAWSTPRILLDEGVGTWKGRLGSQMHLIPSKGNAWRFQIFAEDIIYTYIYCIYHYILISFSNIYSIIIILNECLKILPRWQYCWKSMKFWCSTPGRRFAQPFSRSGTRHVASCVAERSTKHSDLTIKKWLF